MWFDKLRASWHSICGNAHIRIYEMTMRELTDIFKALSDETRLRILNVLLERECCVCEVMQALDISQTRASRNLNILHDAGLLKCRREGAWSIYSVDSGRQLQPVLQLVKGELQGNPDALLDLERLLTAKRVGVSCVRQSGK